MKTLEVGLWCLAAPQPSGVQSAILSCHGRGPGPGTGEAPALPLVGALGDLLHSIPASSVWGMGCTTPYAYAATCTVQWRMPLRPCLLRWRPRARAVALMASAPVPEACRAATAVPARTDSRCCYCLMLGLPAPTPSWMPFPPHGMGRPGRRGHGGSWSTSTGPSRRLCDRTCHGGGGLCLPFLSLVLVFFWTWTLYRLCTYIPLAQVLYVCNNINDDVIIIIIIKRRSGINPIPPTVIDRD